MLDLGSIFDGGGCGGILVLNLWKSNMNLSSLILTISSLERLFHLDNDCILSFQILSSLVTQEDLTPTFLTFSNQILKLNIFIYVDIGSTDVSNIQQNSAELHYNLRF